MAPRHRLRGLPPLLLLLLAIAVVVAGSGYGALLGGDDDDGSADGKVEFLQLKLLSKCVSESTENNTLERWIRCVEFIKGLAKEGIQSQAAATVVEDPNRPSPVKESSVFNLQDSIEGGKQSKSRTERIELNLESDQKGALDEHKIWGVEEEGIVRVLSPEPELDGDEEIWVGDSIRGEYISSDVDVQGGRKEYHPLVEFRRVESSVRFGKEWGLYIDRADLQLYKLIVITGTAVLLLQWLSFRKYKASVNRCFSNAATNSFCQTSLNEMPSKERSFKRKSHKDGFGKAAEQERGQKEGNVPSAFAHLGNTVAIVLAELLRYESLTLKTLKADDVLELLEAAWKEPINLVSCGNNYPYLNDFKATFKSTFTMLNNVHCTHLKLIEKRTGISSQAGHFVNEFKDARDYIHHQALKIKMMCEELEKSTTEEEYHSCDDAADAPNHEFESTSCTGSSRVMERTRDHRDYSDVGKLKASSHDSTDILFFPCSNESTISDSIIQAKAFSNNSTASDRNASKESRIKDLSLVRCTVAKGLGTVYSKDMSCCETEIEDSHVQLNSSVLRPLEDVSPIDEFIGDEEAESSLASEKHMMIEAPSQSTSMQGNRVGLPWQAFGEDSSPFGPRNDYNGDEKAMELVQRPIHTVAKLSEAVVLASCDLDPRMSADSVWKQALLDTFERSVEVQEHHNYIKSVELAHLFKRLSLEEQQLHLTSESNHLMKQNVVLNRSRVNFKLWKTSDKKMETAFLELNRTCTDELIAGLFVMLTALLYGAWNFSYNRLTEVVQYCQQSEPKVKERRKWSWFQVHWYSGPLAIFSRHFQELICHITVVSRMVVGLAIIALIASSLLRHSVTSSSQVMPVTILLVVLGGICGFAGKWSVQSLGGSGLYWLLLWETICALHVFATCFTPTLYYLLNGAHANRGNSKSRRWVAPWIRQFLFHLTLVLLLPAMAGLLPFAAFREVVQTLGFTFFDKLTTLPQSFFIA